MSTVATFNDAATVRDYAAALAWLTQRPNLPAPRGVTISGVWDGEPNILVDLTTAEQVQAWADAVDRPMESREHKGNMQHTVHTFEPFYISATAIVGPVE